MLPVRRILVPAGAAAIVAGSLAVSAPVFASRQGTPKTGRAGIATLTPAKLAADLRKAAGIRRVPSNLKPSLSAAAGDVPVIRKNGCQLEFGPVNSRPCVYGDTASHTSVILFGDSHAAAWFSALNAISKQHHWRLLIFVKSACPAEEVDVVRNGVLYADCPVWRSNTEQAIEELDPALVVVASRQYITEMRPEAGVPTGHGGTWQNGVAAIFSFLRHAAKHTLYVTDDPTLTRSAPECASRHRSDVRRCSVSTARGLRYPQYTADELRIATEQHISAVNADSWFCTSTICPPIVKNILLYRDDQHMTPEWSSFLTPLLDAAVSRAMNAGLRGVQRADLRTRAVRPERRL
ncbi:MAG TPA: SGNH hydrolase domain-containing protein [Solirubrobacteraceae bacterium]|nr:SGNH hydrolase domain-containing protein [Solirubrobacteraceae bacterium]